MTAVPDRWCPLEAAGLWARALRIPRSEVAYWKHLYESFEHVAILRTARNVEEDLAIVAIIAPADFVAEADAILRDKIAAGEMDQRAFELTMARSRDGMKAGHKPGPETSFFKLHGTEINMRRNELEMQIANADRVTCADMAQWCGYQRNGRTSTGVLTLAILEISLK